ncbi:uncharacterized protein LOC113555734 [Rhopalosiphum maidis]|uniref:uncharacterized protein LOC113555734 n=1 Tax=Rhopalosiphum maidis TaxID=43146 RepID=UPI000EFE7AA9|nr:uncharacterized protein LOC113555734 [Rhopalosiphum maidis]
MIQMHLRGKNFDFCRICLVNSKSNKHLTFLNIFKSAIRDLPLKQHLKDLFGIEISSTDTKPKKICNECFIKVANFYEMKRKEADSEKTLNYNVSKESKTANKKSFNNMKLKSTPTDETKLLPKYKEVTINQIDHIILANSRFKNFRLIRRADSNLYHYLVRGKIKNQTQKTSSRK